MDGIERLDRKSANWGWPAVGAAAFLWLFLQASIDLFYYPPLTGFQLFLLAVSTWRADPRFARAAWLGIVGAWLPSLLCGLLPVFVERLDPFSWLVLQYSLAHLLWLFVLVWRSGLCVERAAVNCFRVSLIILFLWLLLASGEIIQRYHRHILFLESFSLVLGVIAFGRHSAPSRLFLAWLLMVLLSQLPATLVVAHLGAGVGGLWRAFELVGHLAFAGCLYGWLRQDANAMQWVVGALASMAIIYSGVVVVFWLQLDEPAMYDWFLNPPLFNHIRHIGYFLCPAIVLCAWAFIVYEGRARLFSWVAYVLALGLLLWSGGRGAFVASATGIAFMLFALSGRYSVRRAAWVLIGFLLALLLASLFPVYDTGLGWLSALARSEEAGSVNSLSTGRLHIWSELWRLVLEKPWFGWGGDIINVQFPRRRFIQAHNAFLQLLVEWGIAGLLIIGGGLLVILLKARFKLNSVNSICDRRVPGSALVIALLVLSMVDGVLYHAMPSILLALGYAMLLSGRESEACSEAIASPRG